ncbi:MAG: exodeoxyribonuclease VII small subunit [Thermoanaerobacteraceae bacterium]|nr:exodeoxyribonuclease VII small subunit [Thermoanaerobacteraceae bacterium]
MNFEGSMKRLEEIVNTLQQGNLNLEESVNLFEEGIRLSNFCREALMKARMKVNILIEENGIFKEMGYEGENGEKPQL